MRLQGQERPGDSLSQVLEALRITATMGLLPGVQQMCACVIQHVGDWAFLQSQWWVRIRAGQAVKCLGPGHGEDTSG